MWIINLFLFFAWLVGPSDNYNLYVGMVRAGATCYEPAPWAKPTDPPPPCFYLETSK